MFRLGLTGGIGSGKSTVAQRLGLLGAQVLDADAVSRNCTLPDGLAMPAIAREFGPRFVRPDGAMDRERMRSHVFENPQAKERLQCIIHPLVQQEMQRQAQASEAACLVFDIALLVESAHWRPQFDRILVVDCGPQTQVKRVMQRNGWPLEQVQAVMRQQCARAQRLAAADWVIHNDGIDLPSLHILVDQLAPQLGL